MGTLLYGLIIIGLLVLIFTVCIYLADSQKSRTRRYGSWSRILNPWGPSKVFDVNEQLNEEITARRQQPLTHHSQRKSHHK